MRFGYFHDQRREYVITTPKTPYPWINYLGNERFFSLISNTSGGYCFYRDARLRRITRYRYNNVPTDCGGRYFYIKDGDDFWTPGWMPVRRELERYECRHGLGYTSITGKRNGISVTQTTMVPLGQDCELTRLSVVNEGSASKRVVVFSFVEFCLWNAYDDMTNFQRNFNTGEVEVEGSAIYHKTEYRERRNHYSFYAVNAPVIGYDTDRETFVGLYNGFDAPAAVAEGRSRNSLASGWAPIASHCVQVDLAPDERRDLIFVLGYVENSDDEKWESPGVINKAKARELMRCFNSTDAFAKAIAELGDYWNELLSSTLFRRMTRAFREW